LVNVSPEYEDCRQVALKKKVPLKEVFEEAKRAAILLRRNGKKAGVTLKS